MNALIPNMRFLLIVSLKIQNERKHFLYQLLVNVKLSQSSKLSQLRVKIIKDCHHV